MNENLQQEMHRKKVEAMKKGVKPTLFILGRSEEPQLEGVKEFVGCEIIIDDKSKSRCDCYGKEGNKTNW